MAAGGAIVVTGAALAGSVALLGFGLDSVIEALASVIVGRFTSTRTMSQTAERRAQKAVAVTFFLLAPYIAADALRTLITAEHPVTTWPGVGVSAASLIVMPPLGTTKKRIGARLGSAAVRGEGVQNLICALPRRRSARRAAGEHDPGMVVARPRRGAWHRRQAHS
jgi:divalent metal cation (Fe/Co/Zn/Cd) transporter